MRIALFLTDNNEANAHLIVCEETGQALLVDAPVCDPRLKGYLNTHNLTLAGVFITHGHYDHVDGLAEVVEQWPVPVYAAKPKAAGLPAVVVRTGAEIHVGDLCGRVAETPGHTLDSISLIFPGQIFTGDALFAGSIGGTTGPEDKARQIAAIREHILTLPEDWMVHTGHGPSTTVGIEKHWNPFLAT